MSFLTFFHSRLYAAALLAVVTTSSYLSSTPSGVYAQNVGIAACPCVSVANRQSVYPSWSDSKYTNADGTAKVVLAGVIYSYPAGYGFGECKKHDEDKDPYCNVANGAVPPEWCADTWCYIDPNNCANTMNLKSAYFGDANLYYSYAACGDSNSFDAWFGANAAASGAHTITDIADLTTKYLQSIVNSLEDSRAEIADHVA